MESIILLHGKVIFSIVIRVDTGRVKPISEHLIGIFFEDINYGADGVPLTLHSEHC